MTLLPLPAPNQQHRGSSSGFPSKICDQSLFLTGRTARPFLSNCNWLLWSEALASRAAQNPMVYSGYGMPALRRL